MSAYISQSFPSVTSLRMRINNQDNLLISKEIKDLLVSSQRRNDGMEMELVIKEFFAKVRFVDGV